MSVLTTATQISQAFKNAGRMREIAGTFVRHGFADLLHRMKLTRFLPQRYTEDVRYGSLPPAERLRMSFEELGPTFVKLGQLLAMRRDLLPDAYTDEFEKLQDNVTKVPFNEIRTLVEAELRAPLETVFSFFEETPMAAASIAQVHGAILHSGERVAVKIQRPGIDKLIQNDVSILRGLAHLLEHYLPETRVFNPKGLVEEFFQTIVLELDFRIEANNIRRIKKNMASLPRVAIPEVHSKFSTEKVLVLERFEGIRFSDREALIAKNIPPMEIVEAGCDAFFNMIMRDGLFHGDLHPGNLFVLPDARIGIIDFGIVGRLSRRVQDGLIIMFIALIDEDFETLAGEYLNLCHSTAETDVQQLQKDLMDVISPYIGMALGEVNIGKVLLRSTAVATRHHLVVPRELMLLFRAILTMEALGKRLDPNFDILAVGTRLARQVMSTRYSKERVMRDLLVVGRDTQALLEVLPRLFRRALRQWAQNSFAIEIKSKEREQLIGEVRQFRYLFVLSTFSICFFSLGICMFVLDKEPHLMGLSLLGIVPVGLASVPLLQAVWQLRKQRPK